MPTPCVRPRRAPRLAAWWLAGLGLACAVTPALPDGLVDAPPGEAAAREVAAKFLRAPGLPPLALGELKPSSADDLRAGREACPVFPLLAADGRDVGTMVLSVRPLAVSSLRFREVSAAPLALTTLDADQLLARARRLAEFACVQNSVEGDLELESASPLGRAGDTRLVFRLTQQVGPARICFPFAVQIGIVATDGTVFECNVEQADLALARASLPSETEVQEAWTSAARSLRLPQDATFLGRVLWAQFMPEVTGGVWPNWLVVVYPKSPKTVGGAGPAYAVVRFGGKPPTVTVHREFAAQLEAMLAPGGEIWWEEHPEEYLRTQLQPKADLRDAWPIWDAGGRGLLLISVRPRPRAAFWNRTPGVMLTSNEGRMAYVLPGGRGVVETGASATDLVAASTTAGRLLLVNLSTGVWAQRGVLQETTYHDVSLSPDGTSLVYAAFRRQGDFDVFVDGLDHETLAERGHLRICRLEGDDRHPVFSPDGQRVYFAHCGATAPKGEEWSVYRVPPDKQYWENTPPEPVVGGFGAIGRLSFFPDGRRLLVWHGSNLDVVDVEAKTRRPLELPELRDPELPADRPPLKLRDPAVSPDGKKLAFSGYRDSGDPQNGTGWYIYTCNMDGSDVKRVTPLSDDPVEPYVFPETGKTAFDVAQEMVEKAQKLVEDSG